MWLYRRTFLKNVSGGSLDVRDLAMGKSICKDEWRIFLLRQGFNSAPVLGIGDDEFLVVERRVAPEHQPAGITPLQFHQQLFILLL